MEDAITKEDVNQKFRDVVFGNLKDFEHKNATGKTIIVSEPRVHALFGDAFPRFPILEVPEGEKAKTIESLTALYRKFASLELDRHSSVLAIGGGSVSDLAGFAAHTWMRGIDFSVAPTSLLAMTDAALGGKNGIDFDGFKNLVGSFHMPKTVFCDVKTLYSLDATQFASGMAEVVKHAVISGEKDFLFLESIAENGRTFDHRSIEEETLRTMVRDSQKVKLDIVSMDFKESGKRKLLNLGHTIGHAVEVLTGMPHGHCVAIGIAAVCGISVRQGLMKKTEMVKIVRLLQAFGLPTSLSSLDAGILSGIPSKISRDKKRNEKSIDFAMPISIGRVEIMTIELERLPGLLGGLQ
jgi:3-dehydroquinate synthase